MAPPSWRATSFQVRRRDNAGHADANVAPHVRRSAPAGRREDHAADSGLRVPDRRPPARRETRTGAAQPFRSGRPAHAVEHRAERHHRRRQQRHRRRDRRDHAAGRQLCPGALPVGHRIARTVGRRRTRRADRKRRHQARAAAEGSDHRSASSRSARAQAGLRRSLDEIDRAVLESERHHLLLRQEAGTRIPCGTTRIVRCGWIRWRHSWRR